MEGGEGGEGRGGEGRGRGWGGDKDEDFKQHVHAGMVWVAMTPTHMQTYQWHGWT